MARGHLARQHAPYVLRADTLPRSAPHPCFDPRHAIARLEPRPHHVPLQQRVNVPLNPAARVLLLVPPQRNARRNVVRLASLPPMNSGAESRMTPS